MGAKVSEVTFGQPGPYGDIDGVHSRQSETDGYGGGRVIPEVAWWDDDNPQRKQGQDVQRGLRPDEIGREPACRVVLRRERVERTLG